MTEKIELMTREDALRLIDDAAFKANYRYSTEAPMEYSDATLERIKRYELASAILAAVAAERERCAKIAKESHLSEPGSWPNDDSGGWNDACRHITKQIESDDD